MTNKGTGETRILDKVWTSYSYSAVMQLKLRVVCFSELDNQLLIKGNLFTKINDFM